MATAVEEARLARLTQDINAGLTLDEVLERLYDSFRGVLPYERIGLALLEDGGRVLRARWARSEARLVRLGAGYSAPMAGSSLQEVLDTGKPRVLNDLRGHLAARPRSESTRLIVQEGFRSSLTCPLVAMGRAVGFLFFSSRRPGAYAHAHVETFSQVAGTVSLILEKTRLYERVVELDRAKSLFLGIAAHDLRGPLANIASYAELLREGLIADEDGRRRALEDVERIARSSLEMIVGLLDVSAIESGQVRLRPRPTAVLPFLEGVASRARLLAAAKRPSLEVHPSPRLPASFTMDPERVEEALANLLSNAVKFSAPGAKVLLRAWPEDGGGVCFAVTDEGPGIPPAEVERLFKDFRRGSARTTGGERSTGLGLAIVKRLVEAHRGFVEAASLPGLGSTFAIHLPPREELVPPPGIEPGSPA